MSRETYTIMLNPPLVATPEMAKVISVQLNKPGQYLEMKADNRYKDGNIRIVKGVVRGNKNTISLNRLEPSSITESGD
jgi:hypothetical protein